MARETIFQALWRLNKLWPSVLAGLLVLNLLVFTGLNQWVRPELESLEREFIEAQALSRKSQQEQASAGTPLAAFHQGQQDLAAFRERVPPRSDFTSLINELFALAQQAGLTIDQVNYDPKEITEERLLRYGLTFAVTGTYRQVKQFAYLLEQSTRLIAIEKITLSGAGEPGQGRVSLRLMLSTVFRMEIE
ncbi:hypothetical protein DESUT3_28350 [Desulfuromonas versatilis]|uniref:Type 4a pilus biogenesis protein PilO n=1 Tax=Desulfuromonas versatilis TaxID=2802975 RepID=A0ABM8HTW5_9BACT|nr:type 4a pilus biogenesis protein PilO [Desulfuromonas versatilis]BCR05766.1 hypothetical protein DESUT3_28350 [Desulfuromonas versatilis]